jgi:hypothetical protein
VGDLAVRSRTSRERAVALAKQPPRRKASTTDENEGESTALDACKLATATWQDTFHAVKTGAQPATAMQALYAADALVNDPALNGFTTGVDAAAAKALSWGIDTVETAPMRARLTTGTGGDADVMECAYSISWAEGSLPGSRTNVAMGIMGLINGTDGGWKISMQLGPMPADMPTYMYMVNWDGSQDEYASGAALGAATTLLKLPPSAAPPPPSLGTMFGAPGTFAVGVLVGALVGALAVSRRHAKSSTVAPRLTEPEYVAM